MDHRVPPGRRQPENRLDVMGQATYQPLKDDGAPFRCLACGDRSHASTMWFVRTPLGHLDGVYHKECLDANWLDLARFVDAPK